jgi:ankyrin repeat protein
MSEEEEDELDELRQDEKYDELEEAIEDDDSEAVQRLIQEEPGIVQMEDHLGQTPLITACILGYIDIVKILVTHGSNINHQAQNGDSALFTAVLQKEIEIVEYLIERGANVNIVTKQGDSSLIMASRNRLDIVELLVTHGANVNHQNKTGYTALFMATLEGNPHIVEYLIIQGADVNARTTAGDTALICACRRNENKSHAFIVQLLLLADADITLLNNHGSDAMFHAQKNKDSVVISLLNNVEEFKAAHRYHLESVSINKSEIPATAEDLINMDDEVNIQDFLAETLQNKVIKVANTFYTLNTKDLKIHYLRQKYNVNFTYYPCKRVIPPPAIGVGRNDVHMDKPLFSASYLVGILSDFVLLNEVQAMIQSHNQYFEIITTGSEVEDIPATASAQMLTSHANAFSANHCQPGKEAKILKLKEIDIVGEKSKSKEKEREGETEAQAEGKRKKKRNKTHAKSKPKSKSKSKSKPQSKTHSKKNKKIRKKSQVQKLKF